MFDYFRNIELVNPWVLMLLGLLPFLVYWKFYRPNKSLSTVSMSSLDAIKNYTSVRSVMHKYLPWLRIVSLVFFIVALARPQLALKEEIVKAEGIDIMLIMDLSSSMLAQDFKPDRLSVSKEVAKSFVDKRQYDRIGLVAFAGESFTQCPLTVDHRVVKDFLDNLQCGLLEDGTAIGMGLASAVNRLKDSESKSKIAILLTDGVNNSGYIKPDLAAEIARELNVKLYSIGVGSMGKALSPISKRSNGSYVFGMARVEIDEKLLRRMAEMTGGQYYRATTEASLEAIYAEIDQLEKTEIEVTSYKRYSDEYRVFFFWGMLFLGIELLLRYTELRTLV